MAAALATLGASGLMQLGFGTALAGAARAALLVPIKSEPIGGKNPATSETLARVTTGTPLSLSLGHSLRRHRVQRHLRCRGELGGRDNGERGTGHLGRTGCGACSLPRLGGSLNPPSELAVRETAKQSPEEPPSTSMTRRGTPRRQTDGDLLPPDPERVGLGRGVRGTVRYALLR